jgi:hypothetical protein
MADRKLTSNTPEPVEDKAVEETPLEAKEQDIDPRLDNRVGNQRPPLETFPAKPQQIDGPDVANSPNAREAVQMMKEEEDNATRKGMASPGPHGLGVTKAVPMEEATNTTVASERASKAADEAKTNAPKKDTK